MIDLEIKTNLPKIITMFEELVGDGPLLIDTILKNAANYETRTTKGRFGKQESPDGQPWPQHSELTKKARRNRNTHGRWKIGRGSRRNQDKGALKLSIVPERTSANEIKVTTNDPKARFMQEGRKWVINDKQAWGMIINLYGFNPDKPWEWMIPKSERKFRRRVDKSESAQFIMGRANWKVATALHKKLKGSQAGYPAAPFMGISHQDVLEIEIITQKHVNHYLRKHARD